MSFFTRHGNVYVYVPNLIGYVRLLSATCAFGLARSHPTPTVVLYLVGFVCDDLDGRAARALGQTSTLGIVLDMVTDRLSTAGLLVILCMLYPDWYMAALLTLMLDIISHWTHMYSTLTAGSSTHKDTNSRNVIVRFYYRSRIFMGFCCICCEVLYLALYLHHWSAEPSRRASAGERARVLTPAAVAVAAVPGWAIKQCVNLVQLRTAASQLVALDLQRDADARKQRKP